METPAAHLTTLKQEVGEKAAQLVKNGQVVGLGTGSTAKHAITALARRVDREGLRITGIATSEASARQAVELGLRLSTLDEHPEVDITIDGADEVAPNLDLIKGLGGALLREKIVAASTVLEVIIVDDSKVVPRLGTRSPLPVEVVPFGWRGAQRGLGRLGASPTLRKAGQEPFRTDSGNFVIDCRFPSIQDARELERNINNIPGVVENGLFLGLAHLALVATPRGIGVMDRESPPTRDGGA